MHLHEALRMVELPVRVYNLCTRLKAVKAPSTGYALHIGDTERKVN
jgi:hypothetical protein